MSYIKMHKLVGYVFDASQIIICGRYWLVREHVRLNDWRLWLEMFVVVDHYRSPNRRTGELLKFAHILSMTCEDKTLEYPLWPIWRHYSIQYARVVHNNINWKWIFCELRECPTLTADWKLHTRHPWIIWNINPAHCWWIMNLVSVMIDLKNDTHAFQFARTIISNYSTTPVFGSNVPLTLSTVSVCLSVFGWHRSSHSSICLTDYIKHFY